jgi:hypothetical protein
MPILSIDIPAGKATEVAAALREQFGEVYVDPQADPLVPETDANLVKHHIIEFLKRMHHRYKRNESKRTNVDTIAPDDALAT